MRFKNGNDSLNVTNGSTSFFLWNSNLFRQISFAYQNDKMFEVISIWVIVH